MERLLHRYFRLLARYNAWANRRVYDRVLGMHQAAYGTLRSPGGRSLVELLDARLGDDRLWRARLGGYAAYERAVGAPAYDDLGQLRDAQLAEDVDLFEYVDGLAEEDLLRPTSYDTDAGETHTHAQHELLTHLFTEQIAARARVCELLHPAPDLEMLTFLHDAEGFAPSLRP